MGASLALTNMLFISVPEPALSVSNGDLQEHQIYIDRYSGSTRWRFTLPEKECLWNKKESERAMKVAL